ncbi:MAG: monovalent cation/H(+) antiporter subunit G [Chloroflexi bacterium]|nr:monovalent cation/H(+) antiporter subunit G [Chloroflexota bacterium]
MDLVGDVLLWSGVFFIGLTCLGLLRLPDFYTRAHAVSKSETLGLGLLCAGMAFHAQDGLVSGKFLLLLGFGALINPLAAHLLTRAAVRSGLAVWTKREAKPDASEETGRS